MAIVHDATLTPTKRDLMAAWLPAQSWYDGVERRPVGSFRFDDPEGEVGLEGFLLGADGVPTLFLPMTYRAAPFDPAADHLIGTAEHSVLGPRWIYDGCADPVFAAELARAILTGGTGVSMTREKDGVVETFETSAQVRGSGRAPELPADLADLTEVGCHDEGATTVVNAGPVDLVVVRLLGSDVPLAETLTGSWDGATDVVLAGVRPG